MTVDGVPLGDLTVSTARRACRNTPTTTAPWQVNELQQDGFPAGSLQSVSVNDKGRVVGTYSNSRTIDLAEVTLATFNGPNNLKRLDGGAFAATSEFGAAELRLGGLGRRLLGRRLELRHRRRVHQADRDAAGLFGQHARDQHQQPDGPGPPEHAAVSAAAAASK